MYLFFGKPVLFEQLWAAGIRSYARILIIYSNIRKIGFFKLIPMLCLHKCFGGIMRHIEFHIFLGFKCQTVFDLEKLCRDMISVLLRHYVRNVFAVGIALVSVYH